MLEHKIKILCTRPVSEALIAGARSKNIILDALSFIETTPIQTIEVQQEIEQAATLMITVVFTSMNAVAAVTDVLDGHVPEWSIYCIGHRTAELVESYFGSSAVAGTADHVIALADLIIENGHTDEVTFFCGNRRRDELSEKLEAQDIIINEIVVYETKNIEHYVTEKYDGVLFFSPSAVDSFFKKNKPEPSAVLFAIGTTTQRTIQQYCKNKIIVSRVPGKNHLIEEAVAFFESCKL